MHLVLCFDLWAHTVTTSSSLRPSLYPQTCTCDAARLAARAVAVACGPQHFLDAVIRLHHTWNVIALRGGDDLVAACKLVLQAVDSRVFTNCEGPVTPAPDADLSSFCAVGVVHGRMGYTDAFLDQITVHFWYLLQGIASPRVGDTPWSFIIILFVFVLVDGSHFCTCW